MLLLREAALDRTTSSNGAGLQPGVVRPTVVARRTRGHFHQAVISAYYYVAGPRTTQLPISCSASFYTHA